MKSSTLAFLLAPALLAGCASMRTTPLAEHCRPRDLSPYERPGRARVWISDGSMARFEGTVKLDRPKLTEPVMGLPLVSDRIEGQVDGSVWRGRGSVPADPCGYDGEAEWTLEFREPFHRLARENRLNEDTPVRIHGMIEGKQLSGMAAAPGSPVRWDAFSIGNNVLTDRGSDWMPLGALDQKQLPSLTMKVWFEPGGSRASPQHTATLSDIATAETAGGGKTRVEFVRQLAQQAGEKEPTARKLRWLNLSALGDDSGFVNEPARKNNVKAGTLLRAFNRDWARANLARRIIDDEVVARAGSTIFLELSDASGPRGRASLHLRR